MGSKLSSFSSSREKPPKRSESPVKQSERPPKRIKTDEKKQLAAKSDGIAVAVVLMNSGFLHWSDAEALGSTCRDTRKVWKQTRNVYLRPLLEVLESMVGSPEKEETEEHDPENSVRSTLLDDDYDTFDVFHKCQELVEAIHFMVHNLQNHSTKYEEINLEDPSNCDANSVCSSLGWSMGLGYETETDYVAEFHRRGTMAVTIAYLGYAKEAMAGDSYYFKDVFLGLPGASIGYGSHFGHVICGWISRMFPFRDKDLAKAAREIYPTASELSILGPLVPKVVLAEPLFRWALPDKEEDSFFEVLPTPLEKLNDDVVIAEGMGRWLKPHDGIDY